MAHAKHIKGDRAELIAAEYFISLGYSVHRNMSQHGPVDLVVIKLIEHLRKNKKNLMYS